MRHATTRSNPIASRSTTTAGPIDVTLSLEVADSESDSAVLPASPRAILALGLLFVGLALAASPCAAGEEKDEAKKSVTDVDRGRGIAILASLGLNGCTGNRCENLAPMLYLRVHPMFRVNRFFSAGVHLAFLFEGPLFKTTGARSELWDALVGPEVRGILPIRSIDIWLGLAFGYFHQRRLVTTEGFEHKTWAHAVGLAWGGGADYFIVPSRVAIGGDIWLYKGWIQQFCSRTGDNPDICSTEPEVDAGSGITIAVGVSLTVLFGV